MSEAIFKAVDVELVLDNRMQPWHGKCPKCGCLIYCDVPKVNVTCPECQQSLIRKDFIDKDIWWHGEAG